MVHNLGKIGQTTVEGGAAGAVQYQKWSCVWEIFVERLHKIRRGNVGNVH